MKKKYVTYEDAHKAVYLALRTPRFNYGHNFIDTNYFEEATSILNKMDLVEPEPEFLPKGQIKEYDNGMVAMNKETYKEYDEIATLQAIRLIRGEL